MDNSRFNDFENKDEIEQHKVKTITPTNDSKSYSKLGCFLTLILVPVYALIALKLAIVEAYLIFLGLFGGGLLLLILFAQQKRVLDIIALCCGICLLTGSGILYFDTQSIINNSIFTEGIIVKYELGGDGKTSQAVIEFETKDGEIIRFNDIYSQNPSIDDSVEVIYNPINPSEARIHTWSALWGWPMVTFFLSISAIVIAALRLVRQIAK